MTEHNGEIFQLEKEFREEVRRTLVRIEGKVDDGFKRVNGSIGRHDTKLGEHEVSLAKHDERITAQENKPSATKAVWLVGGLLGFIVTVLTVINMLK